MNRRTLFALLTLLALVAAGCSRGTSPATSGAPASQEDPERAAIRAALTKYLNERGTLNMDAMEMDIKDVKFTGDRADVQVQFRAKGVEGAGMDMGYVLEREAGAWVVKTSASPGMQTHPPVGGAAGASGELPPSHPPLTPPKKQ